MKRYPTLQAYIQTDPRGCALYILRPGDVHGGYGRIELLQPRHRGLSLSGTIGKAAGFNRRGRSWRSRGFYKRHARGATIEHVGEHSDW